MDGIKQEIAVWFTKAWVWLLYIIVGLVGKFSYDLLTGRKITWWQALASTGIALFFGFLAVAYCMYKEYDKGGMFIVPIATLLSEKLMIAIFAINWKKVTADMVQYIANKIKS